MGLRAKALRHTITRTDPMGRFTFYEVFDGYYKNTKHVRYDALKDIWICTCFYWSVCMKECSHIRRAKWRMGK